ncbi:MAG: hypothetical protein AB7E39_07450 [Endomicrobiaceae bacterium]
MEEKIYKKYIKKLEDVDTDKFLSLSEEEKYKKYGNIDPLPEIQPALLNSADILKYVILTGMIEDFDCKDLSGATYNCRITGEYVAYNKDKQQCSGKAQEKFEIEIAPNSITYVAIKNIFRIPNYIALRFNLRVSHVYKGLLLGTGPIIDPGFVGQIYIPLHNLTSNTYYIKAGAELISVEFTKLSSNSYWVNDNSKNQDIVNGVKEFKYVPNQIKSNRTLVEYIDRALNDKEFFLQKDSPKCVVSAVPDQIYKIDKKFDDANDAFKDEKTKIDDAVKQIDKIDTYVKTLGIAIYIGITISIIALCFGVYWGVSSLLKESRTLSEANSSFVIQKEVNNDIFQNYDELTKRYDQLNQDYSELLKRIENLEKPKPKEK